MNYINNTAMQYQDDDLRSLKQKTFGPHTELEILHTIDRFQTEDSIGEIAPFDVNSCANCTEMNLNHKSVSYVPMSDKKVGSLQDLVL